MNKLEQIAAKKKEAELAKQESEVAKFASRVAGEVVGSIGEIKSDSLQVDVAELAKCVAEAIVLSNKPLDEKLGSTFGRLISAVENNRPDDTSVVEASEKVGRTLAKLDQTIANLELSPEINISGLTVGELREEISRIIDRLPKDSRRIVTLAYENTTPDKYLNVRLTDGIDFYKASGKGGGVDTSSLATSAKQDTLIGHVDGIETKLDTLNTTATALGKPTDVYAIVAISLDSTYKYFFFEDKDANYYVMRKNLSTNVFQYTKGTGGYTSVYVNSTSGPSGSPTWGTYGATF